MAAPAQKLVGTAQARSRRFVDDCRGGICALADTYYLPVTSHDCIGPVALWSAAHLMLHVPNAMIVETVRAYYEGWYNDIVTDKIPIHGGMISLEGKPGLGTSLRPEVFKRKDVHVEVSSL